MYTSGAGRANVLPEGQTCYQKCKRVTRSAMNFKLRALDAGLDQAFDLEKLIDEILDKLGPLEIFKEF